MTDEPARSLSRFAALICCSSSHNKLSSFNTALFFQKVRSRRVTWRRTWQPRPALARRRLRCCVPGAWLPRKCRSVSRPLPVRPLHRMQCSDDRAATVPLFNRAAFNHVCCLWISCKVVRRCFHHDDAGCSAGGQVRGGRGWCLAPDRSGGLHEGVGGVSVHGQDCGCTQVA